MSAPTTPDGRPVWSVMDDCQKRGVEHIVGVAVMVRAKMYQLGWPCRHCHVLHMLSQTSSHLRHDEQTQGFVTNTERFVGRWEAAQIARAAGQTTTESELFSEDLW